MIEIINSWAQKIIIVVILEKVIYNDITIGGKYGHNNWNNIHINNRNTAPLYV